MHLRQIDTGLRFEEHTALRLFVGCFITCISWIGFICIKNEIQFWEKEFNSMFYIVPTLFLSVLGFGYGLYCFFYQNYIDIDIKRKKVSRRKGFPILKSRVDEHDFLSLKYIILSKELDTDMDRKPQIVYSIAIETLSGQVIKIDDYFDKEKAQTVAGKIADITSLEVSMQNRISNE